MAHLNLSLGQRPKDSSFRNDVSAESAIHFRWNFDHR